MKLLLAQGKLEIQVSSRTTAVESVKVTANARHSAPVTLAGGIQKLRKRRMTTITVRVLPTSKLSHQLRRALHQRSGLSTRITQANRPVHGRRSESSVNGPLLRVLRRPGVGACPERTIELIPELGSLCASIR
jgi:hypothetical protein